MIQLARLTYYPIKGCRGFDVEQWNIERMGLEADRRLMVVTPEGHFLTQREHPRLALVTPARVAESMHLSAPEFDSLRFTLRPSGPTVTVEIWRSKNVQAVDQGDEPAEWFSNWLGTPVRLVHFADGHVRHVNRDYAINHDDHTAFADGYPILIASEESLADLNARLETPLPMNRFRPNIVVRGCEQSFAEDTWRRIRIGEVELAIVKPCARCEVTTTNQQTAVRAKEPLKTLATFRKQKGGAMFGQNAIPLGAGRLEVGMTVEILS